ncbi:MAG: hypothetical protein IRZ04_20555 [Rhodospirillales bacterium]|nr:hypothetical protein [Rhodospirillales bacterium]
MTISRIMLALTAALVAAPGSAKEKPAVVVSSPISIAELRDLGAGTVTGTVSEVGPRGFMLNDGSSIWVRSKAVSNLRDSDSVTVTGRFDRGTLKAHRVVAADGTVISQRGHHKGHHRGAQQDGRRDKD